MRPRERVEVILLDKVRGLFRSNIDVIVRKQNSIGYGYQRHDGDGTVARPVYVTVNIKEKPEGKLAKEVESILTKNQIKYQVRYEYGWTCFVLSNN